MKKQILLLMSFLSFTIISCSKNNSSVEETNLAYFPLAIDNFAEFEVERTKFSITNSPESQYFNTRYVIADTFLDINKQLIYQTNYFVQENNTEWKLDSTATVWQTLDKTIGQENGESIIKMIYPLSNGLIWNGNSFNSQGESLFQITDLGKPYQLEDTYFPNTVTIIRQDDSTLLSRKKYIETYALNVGLIRIEKIYLKYCGTPDCLGRGIINSGWKELSTIKRYGK